MVGDGRTTVRELELLLRARYPLIYIISYEERRVLKNLDTLQVKLNTNIFRWTLSQGIVNPEGKPIGEATTDPVLALDFVLNSNTNGIFIFQDLHPFISQNRDSSSICVRKLRDLVNTLPVSSFSKSLILLSPFLEVPMELEKDMAIIDFPLPAFNDLKELLEEIEISFASHPHYTINLSSFEKEEIIKAALGLTLSEAENTFAKILIEDSKLNSDSVVKILRDKEQLIKKSGILEYITPDVDSNAMGGLQALKEWFQERSEGFSQKARESYLPYPRGVLLIGVPGCGKSLCAKVIGEEWKKPLLRFDVGRAFGKYVGESELNMRKAIKIAESLAPCILWIDEIEKEFGDVSGSGDSGTSARVFASFLTWMQEKKSPVFVLATANNIYRLPPEFLRKGRFDEIFFVDLPFEEERKEIFKIHLNKRGKNQKDFNIDLLVKESEGYSGAEIEEAIVSALYHKFKSEDPLMTEDILLSLRETKPLSEVMKENIREMRAWAKDRARYASVKGRTETGDIVDRWRLLGG